MPRFQIHHITEYNYTAMVRDSANQVILFPVKDEYQEVLKHELLISGEPHVDIHKDYFGNDVGSFMRAEPHKRLMIDCKMAVITKSRPLPLDNFAIEDQWEHLRQIRCQVPYIDFLKVDHFDGIEEMRNYVNSINSSLLTPLQTSLDLTKYVYENFLYIKGITTVETTLTEIWSLKAGVCQDFAHILSALLRTLKIPARYVSGYICPNKNGMRGEGATHAWVEAYIPFYGWLGFDPTNNCLVQDLHVRLAVGRSFSDCSPVKGTYKGISDHKLEVGVSVSYENGQMSSESPSFVTLQQASSAEKAQTNSWRKHMEIMQQQQQQQQQQQEQQLQQ
ncbi:MAG: transglutaminase family protein [Chitinophagaceae bacterium]|nr:transglutaminase family protein [Chitinophagaceae bacterium]